MRGQGIARDPHSGEDCSRSVAVVNVAINRHSAGNLVVTLHAADGHGHVVDHAKPLSVVGKRVMKSATDVKCHAILLCKVAGEHGASRSQPKGSYEFRRVRDL